MNGSKILLVLVLLGITIWNIPNTTSIFYNEHSYYNGSAPCQKCHQDIQDILNQPQTPIQHSEKYCRDCHTRDGNSSHSAKILYCINCHEKDNHQIIFNNCNDCHQSHGGIKLNGTTISSCEYCHINGQQIHHLMIAQKRTVFGCMDCHPMQGIYPNQRTLLDRNCIDCHNGTAFWANPIINLKVNEHHNFTTGNTSTCRICHGY